MKYHAMQCYHEGCQWKEQDQVIARLKGRVKYLEDALSDVLAKSQMALDGYTRHLTDAEMQESPSPQGEKP